jgi:hypothetical protein
MKARYNVLLGVILLLAGLLIGSRYSTAPLGKNASNSSPAANKGIVVRINDRETVLKSPRVVTTLVISSSEAKVIQPAVTLCFLPTLGVETGRSLKPRLGCQILRAEGFDLGVSLGLSPDSLDVSVDRDLRSHIEILRNSLVGVGIAVDNGGYTRFLAHFSVFL